MSSLDRWERRVDNQNRVYYVDHNTRTTTWQRPNASMMDNLAHWNDAQQLRSARFDQMTHRFLDPNNQQIAIDAAAASDPLGPMPENWGKPGPYLPWIRLFIEGIG
jgi:hypothetical protein